MKLYCLALTAMLLAMFACKDDEVDPVIAFNAKPKCNGRDIAHCQDAARTSEGI